MFRMPHHKHLTVSERGKKVLHSAHLMTHVVYLSAAALHYGGTMIGVMAGSTGVLLVLGAALHVEL